MRAHFLRFLIPTVVCAALAAPGSGAPAQDDGSAPLTLVAGAPVFDRADDGRRVVPRIAGFGHVSRAGEPMLPLRVLRVAIPPDSVPELRILHTRVKPLGSINVAPVPRARVQERLEHPRGGARGGTHRRGESLDVQEYDDEFVPDDTVYGRDQEYPAAPVRLGSIGYMREQRYVEVLYTPLLVNPATGATRYFPEVRAEVVFHPSGAPDRGATLRAFRPDPLFEDAYRNSLVNYNQGKLFRVDAGDAVTTAQTASSVQTVTVPQGCPAVGSPPVPTSVPAASGPGPHYKLLVSQPGIYRLDYGYVQTYAPALLTIDPGTWTLSAEGVEIPIAIRQPDGSPGDLDHQFNLTDVVEFYGRPKGEPPTCPNYDFGTTFPNVYQANDFTDTQVYWLSSSGAPGSHTRMSAVNGAPVNGFSTAADFEDAAVWDDNSLYLPLGDADPYFSIPSLLANSTQATRDISLALPGIASTAATERISVRLRGGSDLTDAPDHRTRVWINGDTAGGADFTWDGEIIQVQDFNEAQSVLTDPTTIHFSVPTNPLLSVDKQYLDTVTVRYRRKFVAAGDVLTFSYPNQNVRFQVSGFSGAAPLVYEITRSLAGSNEPNVVRYDLVSATVSPPSTYTFDVSLDPSLAAGSPRTFVVAGPAGARRPDATLLASAPVLHDPANAADIVVIASRDSVDAAQNGALDTLLKYRYSAQDLTSMVVYVDQIYDEFSYGLMDVNAIRAFLAYAFDNWKGPSGAARPPSFALLVGDASPDYKDLLGYTSWIEQVPTPMMFHKSSILGYYSSDNWIASFRGGDQAPDIYLGRISTRDAASSADVFNKILRYEQASPPGLWKGHAALVTSEGKSAGEALNFEVIQDRIAATYFSTAPYSVPTPPLYFGEPPWNGTQASQFHDDLVNELQSGAAMLSYIGHGSFETWGVNTFFTTTDAARLTNLPLPFMMNVNCLTGGFHYLGDAGALGEAMVNNGSGGAIAVFAPSGLSNIFVGNDVSTGIFDPLFGAPRQRLLAAAADSVRTALWSQGSILDAQSYTFLGDPATLLTTPAPSPPTGLSAAAGNAQVTLSWAAPSQPVAGYTLYRASKFATSPYTKIACAPQGPTSCLDTTVSNATAYFYYATSKDSDGFEGPPSNFNTDCGTGGPDCVTALPLNPGPPAAPTGLSVVDPATGGALSATWTANAEHDLQSYALYYGTSPGQHPSRVIIPAPAISTTLNGLEDGQGYYLVLTATNTSGHESAPSQEVFASPHLILGIAPPRAITDLAVNLSGANIVLTWSRPTVDVYGRPTTIARYDIYRATTPGFIPSVATRIGTNAGATITTFTDPNAAVSPSSLYYLVTATDVNGLVSGAGRDLPNGIENGLSLSVVTKSPLVVRLTWPAVQTDIQGLPTIIDHYQVHRTPAPVGRASLNSSTIFRDNVTVLSVDLDLTSLSGPSYFSVIAVDDRGNLSPF